MKGNKVVVTIQNVKSMSGSRREKMRRMAYDRFQAGETAWTVSQEMKVRYSSVCRWFRKFREHGEAAVVENHRGPEVRASSCIQAEEQEILRTALTGNQPEEYGLEGRLGWTSKAIQAFIRQHFGKEVCLATARRYKLKLMK